MSRFSRPPFFVLGCVRSGTTMLRQILARHPALVCPEETHLFRWPHPFGTPDYRNLSANNRTLRRHREIDGIAEDSFAEMLAGSLTRRELAERYMEAYAAERKPGATRWFEKSPQNVYGVQLIRGLFPEARILHIVRHPLEVVASLKLGKVMKVTSVVGAANYWLEAVAAMHSFAEANAGHVWQVRYEDLTTRPEKHLEELFAFLDEPLDPAVTTDLALAPASHSADTVLSEAEIACTWRICGDLAASFGYERWPAAAAGEDPVEASRSPAADDEPASSRSAEASGEASGSWAAAAS